MVLTMSIPLIVLPEGLQATVCRPTSRSARRAAACWRALRGGGEGVDAPQPGAAAGGAVVVEVTGCSIWRRMRMAVMG